MLILHRELAHPTQASRVLLNVFEQPQGGFLVTEHRRGSVTVVRTLGCYDEREPALAAAERRAAELVAQRYTPVAAAA